MLMPKISTASQESKEARISRTGKRCWTGRVGQTFWKKTATIHLALLRISIGGNFLLKHLGTFIRMQNNN